MTIEKKLLGTNPVSGEVLPEAVSFDRANDYLYRSSDLTGNSDGKTFTFSCWFYGATGGTIYHSGGAGYTDGVSIGFEQSGELNIKMDNPSGSTVFSVEHGGAIAMNTWNHLLISCNMSSTSNRHIYVNDVALGNNYLTYTNSDIDFTSSTHSIVQLNKLKGRLAHLFLDYTYRNLSTTSNRRLFIDADGKPSSTIPSSPILYLPMTDAATAGSNSGTGGDFTVNGVLATAERGPNQDNCSASTFDGSNDYLSRSGMSAGVGKKQLTISLIRSNNISAANILAFGDSGANRSQIRFTQYISAEVKNPSNTPILAFEPDMGYKIGANAHVTISFDLTDTSKRHVYVNGLPISVTWNTYTNDSFDVYGCDVGRIAGDRYNGTLGEFFIDTVYYDLATENPFWDSDLGKPNSVRKVIADTSVTPLIALPIMGNDAGNNLGSGGDFTVNSGPYTGARGGSEFWARSVEGTGSSGISLTRSAMSGGASSPNLTVVFSVYLDSRNSQKGWFGCGGNHFLCYNDSSGNVFIGNAFADSVVTISNSSSPFSTGSWHTVLWSMVSNGTSSQRHIYVDGVSASNQTWVQTRSTFDLTGGTSGILSDNNGSQNLNGKIAGLYIDQTYTDFSQESNRNKFIDQLGYPIDLGADGSEPTGSSPLVYMKFDNTASFGTNVGTGGNYTVNGAVTSGADFTP